jgi:Alpha/beta hydrolase domain
VETASRGYIRFLWGLIMRSSLSIAVCVTLMATLQAAQARITKIKITRIESPTFEGRAFGNVGLYEKLVGSVEGELDPADPHNSVITDLALAPRNANGKVAYATDIMILRPVDRAKGNRKVWYELTNRGAVLAFSQFNDAASGGNDPTRAADAGNGFLMTQGYSVLISGWDISAPPGGNRFTMKAPIAVNPDGSPIIGPAMEEFVIDDSQTMIGALTYPAATLDKSTATLTMRGRYQDQPSLVAANEWDFANEAGTAIRLAGQTPFRPGTLYEFVYQAKNPVVAGTGFAAIRDLASFLRSEQRDGEGNLNPLAGEATAIYTACVSQPCRTMHDFLWLGFNTDEGGKKAVDGIVNWIGGATGIFMNYRFAQPFRTHRQHIGRWFPEFQGPFTNQVLHDPVTGKTDGRVARCSVDNTCPKIFEVNSANEYWAKNMAVSLVDSQGKDIPTEPSNVRSYFMASLPHQGGFGAPGRGICQQTRNPLVANAVLRALLVDMDQWVTAGTEPPASRLPHLADGTLAPPLPQDGQGFPQIPGVKYNGRMHTGDLFDYGPKFDEGLLTILPPRIVGTPYSAFVPKTDPDGNDIAGIRLPEVAVPLATYTGWNLRAAPEGGDDGCDHFGQQIEFARTKAERIAAADSRPSLEERYPSRADYVNAVASAAKRLASDRLLLDEDVRAYVSKAQIGPVRN